MPNARIGEVFGYDNRKNKNMKKLSNRVIALIVFILQSMPLSSQSRDTPGADFHREVLDNSANDTMNDSTSYTLNPFIERGGLVKDNWPSTSEYEKLVSHHIGMIGAAQAFLHGSLFGFGIDYFIYINKKKTMSGFLICLRLGKF